MNKLRSHKRKLGTYNFKIYIYIYFCYICCITTNTHINTNQDSIMYAVIVMAGIFQNRVPIDFRFWANAVCRSIIA